MKKILYKNPEGGVCIVCPVDKDKLYPQMLAKHKRDHEKAEKAKRKALEAKAAEWRLANPGDPDSVAQPELPAEFVYVRTECPEFVFTDADYEAHVRERSLKLNDAEGNFLRMITAEEDGCRDLEDADIPKNRMFRNAWCDDLPNSRINIDMKKAQELSLVGLRAKRDANLKKTDGEYMMLLEKGDNPARMDTLKVHRQKLRDATETLKAMDVDGKYDDDALLQQMCDECEKDLSEGAL